jgi:hypothetical protein
MIFFERQLWHVLLLAGLLAGVVALLNDTMLAGQFLGVTTKTWLILAIAVPILHQVYVWLVWRTELHYGLITHWFGKNGFIYYAIGFTILLSVNWV